jgi:hypothetical protein
MKNLWLIVVLLMVGTTVSFGAKADKAYTGEIMDSTCAKMGNHDAGYKLTGTSTAKDCSEACVKSGAKYVLYNPSTKTVYELDNQDKAKDLAGQKVKVEGTLNHATNTIHVDTIQTSP